MAEAAATTQIIKQSIVWRAKYQVYEEKTYPPSRVVPHPQNRGGDAIKHKRCTELTGTLAKDGFNPIEANSNGVLVEAQGNNFRNAFVKSIEGA